MDITDVKEIKRTDNYANECACGKTSFMNQYVFGNGPPQKVHEGADLPIGENQFSVFLGFCPCGIMFVAY